MHEIFFIDFNVFKFAVKFIIYLYSYDLDSVVYGFYFHYNADHIISQFVGLEGTA